MTAPPDDIDLHAAIAALRAERDAALSEKAALAAELAAQTVELAERKSEFGERIAQQAATIDVLKVMSASPGDPQPVFDLIVRRATELCNGLGTTLLEFDGGLVHYRANYFIEALVTAANVAYAAAFPSAPTRGSISCRAILDREIVHIRDTDADLELSQVGRELLKATLVRSQISIPLMRDGQAIGAISLAAHDPGGFSDSQIELLKTFAEQAVIAITSAETYRALQTRTSELQESLEYQTATSEVLKVISRSTFDLKPVLDTLVQTAARLCDAEMAMIFRRNGAMVMLAASFGFPPEYEAYHTTRGAFPYDPSRLTTGDRAMAERRPVHIDDIAAVPGYPEVIVRLSGQRTTLGIPLMHQGEAIGTIVLARQRVEPFTDRQIDLVSTFAAQAVIAIENTRLITEQHEALEQQTATAEVLQVINASPGNLAPVFDAMLEKAMHLCGAAFGELYTLDRDDFRPVALMGIPAALAAYRRSAPPPAPAGSIVQRIREGADIVHTADAKDADLYRSGEPTRRALVDLGGARSVLTVALRKDEALLGFISIYRQEVRLFTDRQIALLENFAAQAVIAMENARLINEQREALEQQTATAEVLQVINASPGDLTPVFDAMLEKALRLCDATFGDLLIYNSEAFHRAAMQGVTSAMAEFLREPIHPESEPGSALYRIVHGQNILHQADITDDEVYRSGVRSRRILADLMGARTRLMVALRKDDILLGVFNIFRQEVRPFSDKQIALLENFAAQAVIAMENARLINEQREALEQQTATAEVLQVINANPGNLTPVFDTLLTKAMHLCDVAFGTLRLYDGERLHLAASQGASPALLDFQREPLRPGPGVLRMLAGQDVINRPDIIDGEAYRSGSAAQRALVELGGARSNLAVALRRAETLLGYISVYRREVRPFTDKQIALLQNFAAQAVIAIENARLITEQREALEQQTATAEVLQVINASPGNLTPVFDAILEKAMHLCGVAFGILDVWDGEHVRSLVTKGLPMALADWYASNRVRQPGPMAAQLLRTKRPQQHPDTMEGEGYRTGYPGPRALVDLGGARTGLVVPLLKDDTVRGWFTFFRQEVRAFSVKEVALLENFAAQAVIAMENARLLDELRQRTADLQETLEYQTATSDVLKVIGRSTFDLQPVLDAVVETAARLCDADSAVIARREGELLRGAAYFGYSTEYRAWITSLGANPLERRTVGHRAVLEGRVVHVHDVAADPNYPPELIALGKQRTSLGVPLLREGEATGMIVLTRQRVEPFTDRQIELVSTFADQAVIAIENTRLITEQREALERQTATAEVLQVINASPGNLAPVFDAILEKAVRLCQSAFGTLFTYDGQLAHFVAAYGMTPEMMNLFREPVPPAKDAPSGRIADGEPFVHVLDATDQDIYRAGDRTTIAFVDQIGARTALFVGLRKDATLLGYLVIFRREIHAFSDKEIALVMNFAAQAVIAMENARLITEQREALEQQTATAEVLGVINRSPGDLTPVFDAILNKAHVLCGATMGNLTSYKDGYCQVLATHGLPEEIVSLLRQPYRPNPATQGLIDGERFHQIEDIRAIEISDPVWSVRPITRALIAQTDVRTILLVPLRKDGALLGLITAYRREVRLFSEKEISLLENFAAQAVVAMENARLLNELRARTDELAQRQAELRVTFDNMGDGVAMFDTDLRLAAWNRNFQRIIDLPDTFLETRPSYADYLRLLAERGEFGTTDIEAELSLRIEDTDKELRLERVRPDGRVIEVRRNAVPGGGFVLIYSDITERKRSEEQIRAARDAAETALRELRTAQANLIQAEKMASLGQLTAGIAHEIKNPLNFVNNFAALSVDLLSELKETAAPGFAVLSEKQRIEVEEVSAMLTSNLEKITEHGKRADGIVKAMLEHSRGSSGERRMIDLNALIDEALNLAYHGARAQDQSFNITLERDFGEGIAPIEVNPQDMTRVFLNVFSNGFYATTKRAGDGGDAGFAPTLKVTTRDTGDAVEIRVRDNGTGIPAEIRDKLFQPFFTTKPTGEGTGLGLSITYDIVTQQHGGAIAADSIVGEYSEFTIRLPRNP